MMRPKARRAIYAAKRRYGFRPVRDEKRRKDRRSISVGRPEAAAPRLLSAIGANRESSPDILGGTPVFRGTRVPITTLFDNLVAGDPLERFLDHFPTVKREQAVALLDELKHAAA